MEDYFATEVRIPLRSIPWEPWTRFVGQPAGHSPYIYTIISEVLSHHEVHGIVEIGTMYGALTMYLGMWGVRLGVPVVSLDIDEELSESVSGVLDALDVVRYRLDCFTQTASDIITGFAGGRPIYLICDGGDKPRELREYGPLLPIGSVISVHDWGEEIVELDCGCKFHSFQPDNWRSHGANLATIIKIGEDGEETVH